MPKLANTIEIGLSLLFAGRAEPVSFRLNWPAHEERLPTPGEVEATLREQGALTTTRRSLVSWDPDAVEFSEVALVPKPAPTEEPPKQKTRIPPGPARRRHG